MIDSTKLISILKSLPRWARIVVLTLIAVSLLLVGIFTLESCSTVRVVGNAGNSKVQVQQHALDSMQVSVQFIPLNR